MKKFLALLICSGALSLMAESTELFIKVFKVEKGTSEINYGKKLFSRSLKLTAGKEEAAKAYYKQYFLTTDVEKFEFSGEIKGTGTAFAAIQLLDIAGKEITTVNIAKQAATDRYRDFEGEVKLSQLNLRVIPVTAKLIIGVEKGGSISFTDMEIEADKKD